jgi:MOSC domain-containing protein YiiM
MTQQGRVQDVFTGHPREIVDERGTWTSSICRDRTKEPVEVSLQGLAGDKVAQPYHGGPSAAVCVHLADHYAFWRKQYGIDLPAGSVGENVTLANLTEHEICVGDIVRLGTAIVQVSGPRVPCANLARRIGRADWVKLTIRENRTGHYLRVLEPGILREGDSWVLQERLNPAGSIPAINRCMYLEFDPGFAHTMLDMLGLGAWWKDQARQKLVNAEHWTPSMQN